MAETESKAEPTPWPLTSSRIEGEMVVVEPVVAERIAPQLGRGDEPPVGPDVALLELVGQERPHVMGGLLHLVGQPPLALQERLVGLVALEQVDVALGVIADPRQELEAVGQLDDVVVGPQRERLGLDRRLFLGREHDQRRLAGRLVGPEHLDQGQAVDIGHDQVLKDHRGLEPVCLFEGLGGVAAVMEDDVGLAGEHAAHGLADHGLVVDQQDRDLVLGQDRFSAHARGSRHSRVRSRDVGFKSADG